MTRFNMRIQFSAAKCGPSRKIVDRREEIINGHKHWVETLECGHTFKWDRAKAHKGLKTTSRRCPHCPLKNGYIAEPL